MKYVYWDTNCFLALLQREHPNADNVAGVVAMAGKSLMIVTSVFTVTEVVKYKGKEPGPARYPISSSERLALDECLGPSNGVIPVNVDMQVARMAREAIWDYGVDPKDAIHVATAMRFRDVRLSKGESLEFHTFDKGLLRKCRQIDMIDFMAPTASLYPYQPELGIPLDEPGGGEVLGSVSGAGQGPGASTGHT